MTTIVTLEERIKKAIEDADVAFWEVIAKQFPEIKSGDFPPDAWFKFSEAQEKAVKVWYEGNREKMVYKVEELLEEPHHVIVRNLYAYIEDRSIHDDFDPDLLDQMLFDKDNIPQPISIKTLEDEGFELEDLNVYLETKGKIV